MASVEIDITTAGLDVVQSLLDPKRFKRDVAAGLRYAGKGATVTAAKEIGALYNLTAARIKKDIRKPQLSGDSIRIPFARTAPTLNAFGARPLSTKGGKPTGLKASIFRGQRISNPKAFWLKLPGGGPHGLPFRRPPLGSQTYGYGVAYGPSIGAIFTGKSRFGDQLRDKTSQRVQEQFIKGVQREIDRRSRGF